MLLSDYQIQIELKQLDKWIYQDKAIHKDIAMHNWKGVMMLANAVAHIAEVAWHHPELHLSYSRIKVSLTTHDEGGITTKDIALARKIDQLTVTLMSDDEKIIFEGNPDTLESRYLKNH